jgi:hypothetical protein
MMDILDNQLHAIELCIFHGIYDDVEGFEHEGISQMCRCIGRQSWCTVDGQKDFVGGIATPWEVLWHAEWAFSMATAMNIQTQASE